MAGDTQETEPPSSHVYANLLWHYARGLAFARKHDFSNANKELEALQSDLKQEQLKAPAPNFANPGINGANVAEKILMGVIAEEQNNISQSINFLKAAVALEDAIFITNQKIGYTRQGNIWELFYKSSQLCGSGKSF